MREFASQGGAGSMHRARVCASPGLPCMFPIAFCMVRLV